MSSKLDSRLPSGTRILILRTTISSILSWRLCLCLHQSWRTHVRRKIQQTIVDYITSTKKNVSGKQPTTSTEKIIHTLSQSARRLYHAHNYSGALAIWNYCAIAFGHHSSAAIVAYLLLESRSNWKGLGIPQNIPLAFDIATEGALKGSQECEGVVALCHLFAIENKDKKRSTLVCDIVKKNEGQNDVFNLLAMAECLCRGFGSIKKNETQSTIIFAHLAASGLPYALVKMAYRRNGETEKRYLLTAVNHDYSNAWYYLGMLYNRYNDFTLAIECFLRARTTESQHEMINLLCDNKFNGCEALLHPVFGISCFVVVIITITFTWSFETREMKEPSSTKYKKKWIESSKEVTYEEIVSSKNLSQFLQLVDKQIVTSYGWNASRNVFNLNETKDVITKEYNISYELDKTQQEDVKCLSVDTKEMKIFESSVHRSIQKKYDTFLASLVI
jgi:hypothetical protein